MLTKRYASARDLDGVIDLERLHSGSSTSLERDAASFLDLTYPSSDVHDLARGLSGRFNGDEQPGAILAHSAKGLETMRMTQSLAVLERFSHDPDEKFVLPIPHEFNKCLSKSLSRGFGIQEAWSEIEVSSVVQILAEVRSRLLDFVLRLREQLPEDPGHIQKQSVDTKSLFSHAILGDNTTIIIGDKNKTDIVNLDLKDNLQALRDELKKHDVSASDIDELENAIKKDESSVGSSSGELGSSVRGWIKRMLHKAVEATWQIELAVASAMLTDALKRYYGWKQ